MKPFPRGINDRQRELDRRIESGDPEAIALGLIRALNQDNDCLYNYTQGQLATLAEGVKEVQAQGRVFTLDLVQNIGDGSEGAILYSGLSDVLDQIHQCEDGNGEPLPGIDQPFHFDSFPIYNK
jgi:hypothetical protein